MDSFSTDIADTAEDIFSIDWTDEMVFEWLKGFELSYLFANDVDNYLIENTSIDEFTNTFSSSTQPKDMASTGYNGAAPDSSGMIQQDRPVAEQNQATLGNAQSDNSSLSFPSVPPAISFNDGTLQNQPLQQIEMLVHGDIQAACMQALYSPILVWGGSPACVQQSSIASIPLNHTYSNEYITVTHEMRGCSTPWSTIDRRNNYAVGVPDLPSTPVKSFNGLDRHWPPNHALQVATPVHYINDRHVGEPKGPKRYLSEVSSNATATLHDGSVALDSMSRMVVGLESQPTKRCYMKRVLSTAFKNETVRKTPTCSFCGKKFPSIKHLKVHYRSYTKERPFRCCICDRKFSTVGNMKVHVIDKHAAAYDLHRQTGFPTASTVDAANVSGIKRTA